MKTRRAEAHSNSDSKQKESKKPYKQISRKSEKSMEVF